MISSPVFLPSADSANSLTDINRNEFALMQLVDYISADETGCEMDLSYTFGEK